MKYFSYHFYKLCNIVFLAAVLIAYFKKFDTLLLILSSSAMYSIALQIIIESNNKKVDLEVKEIVRNKGFYRKINIIPFYIMAFFIFVLAFLQNINFIEFSSTNNLIVSILLAIYMLYKIKKYHRVKIECDKEKQELIKKYGKEKFEKTSKELDAFHKEMKEKFKDMFK